MKKFTFRVPVHCEVEVLIEEDTRFKGRVSLVRLLPLAGYPEYSGPTETLWEIDPESMPGDADLAREVLQTHTWKPLEDLLPNLVWES